MNGEILWVEERNTVNRSGILYIGTYILYTEAEMLSMEWGIRWTYAEILWTEADIMLAEAEILWMEDVILWMEGKIL